MDGNGWHALPEHPGGNPFEAVDQLGELDLRWVIDKEVNMVVLTFKGSQLNTEVIAYLLHHLFENIQRLTSKDPFAVFGHKDQMCVNGKDTMPTFSDFSFD